MGEAVKTIEVKEDKFTEFDYAFVAYNMDPRLKYYKEVEDKTKQIFNKVFENAIKEKDMDMLIKALNAMEKHRVAISKDFGFFYTAMKNMTAEERELAKAVSKKFGLINKMQKEKDDAELFKGG